LEYVARELHNQDFATLGVAEQEAIRADAEERYISYVFLKQSRVQHGTLKVDLKNNFTTGNNHFPKTRQQTLHLLDKYSKTAVTKTTPSEGTSFAQSGGGGQGRGNASRGSGGRGSRGSDYTGKSSDKEFWKDKLCFKCGKKGHPSFECPNDKDDDDKSRSSKTSKSSVSKKLSKDMKSMKKVFMQFQTAIEADSDISDSKGEEALHFQYAASAFQFTQMDRELGPCITQVDCEFEPHIAQLFKQAHGAKINIDLRQVILLDSQSTMDLICN